MKPTLLITFSFLLFAFTTNLPLTFSDDKRFLAVGGVPIAAGEVFCILPNYPPTESDGGGLILGQTENSTCPLTVLQHFSAEFSGLPVLLTSSQNPNAFNNATISTQLDIAFIHKPINCAKSFKWVVVVGDNCPYPWVGIGDDQDYSGKKILSGRFHVQKVTNSNRLCKLVFCFCPHRLEVDVNTLGGTRICMDGV